MPEYSKSKIYKILNVISDDVYVGSTCQELSKRFHAHKCNVNLPQYEKNKFYCKMKEFGLDNFYIELVENYPCSTREELRAREGEWIRKISTLNKLIAGRDWKGYYDDNAELLRQKSKYYRASHMEQVKASNKAYAEAHKEERKAKRKIYNEKNRDIILEKKRQAHIANKEKEREYAKQRYEEEGKTQVECACGCVVTKCNLTRHQKSKKHEELMKQKENPQE
jgi:hypothetical protein